MYVIPSTIICYHTKIEQIFKTIWNNLFHYQDVKFMITMHEMKVDWINIIFQHLEVVRKYISFIFIVNASMDCQVFEFPYLAWFSFTGIFNNYLLINYISLLFLVVLVFSIDKRVHELLDCHEYQKRCAETDISYLNSVFSYWGW